MTDHTTSHVQRLRLALQTAWNSLAPRERALVGSAAALVGLALLWWLTLAPALATLRTAPAQHRLLDAQLTQMRRLAATADGLRAQHSTQPLAREAAERALEQATTATLAGTAQLSMQGDRITVTLRGASPEALAQWLAQVRVNARVVPVQAELQQTTEVPGWTGQLVLAGPGFGAGN